jgi:hypothetical protein
VGRLFVLDVSGGRILSMSPDGADRKVIVTGHNDEVLTELGFTGGEIDGLRAGGTIPPPPRHLEAAGTQHETSNRR